MITDMTTLGFPFISSTKILKATVRIQHIGGKCLLPTISILNLTNHYIYTAVPLSGPYLKMQDLIFSISTSRMLSSIVICGIDFLCFITNSSAMWEPSSSSNFSNWEMIWLYWKHKTWSKTTPYLRIWLHKQLTTKSLSLSPCNTSDDISSMVIHLVPSRFLHD